MAEEVVAMTMRLPKELVERVDKRAHEERRSRSNMIIVLLEKALGDSPGADTMEVQ